MSEKQASKKYHSIHDVLRDKTLPMTAASKFARLFLFFSEVEVHKPYIAMS